ncbi:anti-sigma factor family protein [Streptomyces sp. NPDC058001]|uniref:anti-sigma factor family protein n=1 Tax=Streptomyces sp. NPDC058001 TaxID=3346300 RepID=UPI0036E5FD7D
MTNEVGAHPAEHLLRLYVLGGLAPPERELVEPHLDRCQLCRERLAHGGVPAAVDRVWDRLSEAIDIAPPSMTERWLLRLRVPDHVARLVTAVPALRASWLGASGLLLVFAALAARLFQPDGAADVYIALVPLLPVAGVAASFDHRWDPVRDVALVAPLGTFRLVLLRTAVVLGTCVALSSAAALTLPGFGWEIFGWLLPSCALTALSLLLSTRLTPAAVCAVVGGGWAVLVLLTRHSSWLASVGGQLATASTFTALLLLLVVFRSAFDIERKVYFS